MGFENLFLGFSIAITPFNLFVAVVGHPRWAPIIGVLPGLGGANGVAILLPLHLHDAADLGDHPADLALLGRALRRRHHLDPVQHPGRAVVGGHHLRRLSAGPAGAGRAGPHGRLHLVVRGALFSDRADHARSPPLLAEIALKFGPPEFFAIQLLTFSSFVGLGGGNPLKSLVSILLRLHPRPRSALDIVTGQLRMTFGVTELMKGFDFIIAVIGLFGIGEILLLGGGGAARSRGRPPG